MTLLNAKKVKLKTANMLKRFARYLGGDMSESVTYFVEMGTNRPMENTEDPQVDFHAHTFHVLDHGEEFLVVDHPNPISKQQYELMKNLFDTVDEGRGSYKGVC